MQVPVPADAAAVDSALDVADADAAVVAAAEDTAPSSCEEEDNIQDDASDEQVVEEEAVVLHSHIDVDPLRVTIAAGNQRALRVWSSLRFTETQRFHTSRPMMGSDTFVVLECGRRDVFPLGST